MIEAPGTPKRDKYADLATKIAMAVVLVLLAWYLYNNREVLALLRNISWQQILLIVLLDAASFLLNSAMDQSMINRLEPAVRFLDCYLLQYANNFLNKVLPTIGGGAVFRAVFLKKKYGFPYSKFVSTVAGLYVISFLTVSAIGIACLLVIYVVYGLFNLIILAAFMGILVSCLFVILFSPSMPDGNGRLRRMLRSAFEGWAVIKHDARFILVYILFSILVLSISAFQAFIIYSALGAHTNMLSMLFLSTLGIILAFLNFTPDGIGVREAVYVFSAALVHIPGSMLVLGSLVLRGVALCTTFVIGGLSYWILLRRLRALQTSTEPGLVQRPP